MAKPTKGMSFSQWIMSVLMVLPSLFNIITHVFALIDQEVRAAGRGLLHLVLLLIVTATLLVSIWFCVLALLFMYLTTEWHLSWHFSLILILI